MATKTPYILASARCPRVDMLCGMMYDWAMAEARASKKICNIPAYNKSNMMMRYGCSAECTVARRGILPVLT